MASLQRSKKMQHKHDGSLLLNSTQKQIDFNNSILQNPITKPEIVIFIISVMVQVSF
jgi:hypothetical protein